MAELADAHASRACGETHEGSTPSSATTCTGHTRLSPSADRQERAPNGMSVRLRPAAPLVNNFIMNLSLSSPTSKIRKVILVISIVGVSLMVIVALVLGSGLHDIAGEVISPFISLYWLPAIILFFSFKDYTKSQAENKKLNFTKSILKGVLISFIVGVVDTFIASIGASREAGLGLLFILPVLLIGGLIFQLILTTIFYLKSSRKVTSAN